MQETLFAARRAAGFEQGVSLKTWLLSIFRDYDEQYNWKNFFHGNVSIASFKAAFPTEQALEKPSLG